MRITSAESLRASRLEPLTSITDIAPAPRVGDQTSTAAPAAQVEFSARAQALSAARAEASRFVPAVNAAPDIREDLVANLRSQIASGSYHVSSADIADQMIRRAQADRTR